MQTGYYTIYTSNINAFWYAVPWLNKYIYIKKQYLYLCAESLTANTIIRLRQSHYCNVLDCTVYLTVKAVSYEEWKGSRLDSVDEKWLYNS